MAADVKATFTSETHADQGRVPPIEPHRRVVGAHTHLALHHIEVPTATAPALCLHCEAANLHQNQPANSEHSTCTRSSGCVSGSDGGQEMQIRRC